MAAKKDASHRFGQGRGHDKKYRFTFIGDVQHVYEDIITADRSKFREAMMNIFDLDYGDLKDLDIKKGDNDNEYKIICVFEQTTRLNPQVYMEKEFDKVQDKEWIEGEIEECFDVGGSKLMGYEGRSATGTSVPTF